ncbi:DUF4232 domain-containing protein [Streptomyces sp. NRRL F-2664]|uniref:DUF4232 domain-containing protein n=1 Tax=Streptomyces sp. NRRL F-2664 TaxID=1463842 RepID=UPI00068EB706|nr:DUF4232 domain-containing protein [Streptomyces sp. NRRL F-2664]
MMTALGAVASPPASAAATAADAPPPCRGEQLAAGGAERVGADVVQVTLVNQGPAPCVLRGYPSVAVAGQGAPDRARALAVIREGPAYPVELEAGAAARTRIAFTPVLGEADGYCASGAEPLAAPSVVIGAADAHLQLAPDDGGTFALGGDTVRATAFRPPS